jgi:dynein heavy chain, axonemal
VRALNEHYQACFHKEKAKLQERPEGNQFDFSEMSIFGKFDSFCRRTVKIEEMLGIIDCWAALSRSKIEGLEPINAQFRMLITQVKKKPYDVLNTRKTEFDTDFVQFKQDIADLLGRLQDFLDKSFDSIPSVMRALVLLGRFERIKELGLDLHEKYEATLGQYAKEIEEIRKIYQRDRTDPPIGRNLPPMAGRITWARQLFSRIESPMQIMQQNAPDLLRSPEGKKVVKNYNKLGHVLMEYEMLYHRAWIKAVDAAQSGLAASLLVRDPESGRLLVNRDQQVLQLLRETAIMQKLKLEIPESAKVLCIQEDRLKRHESALRVMLVENDRIISAIPERLQSLLAGAKARVDAAIEPGLLKLSWYSVSLDSYLEAVNKELAQLDNLVKKIRDLVDVRIEGALYEITQTSLCELPGPEGWSVPQFLEETDRVCTERSRDLERKSALIERAVRELVDLLSSKALHGAGDEVQAAPAVSSPGGAGEGAASASGKGAPNIAAECSELRNFFNHRMLDALIKCTRASLDSIKRRLTTRVQGYDEQSEPAKPPFFTAKVTLAIPNITMVPALDDIQKALNKAVLQMLNVSRSVVLWGQDRSQKSGLKNYGQAVSENKDIAKLVGTLSSAINFTKKEIQDLLDGLAKYNSLWKEDRDAKTKGFLETKPDISAFEAAVREYEDIEIQINELPATSRVGSVELETEPFKMAMTAETRAWKQAFGKNLNAKALADMNSVFEFCDDVNKRLGREIKDLDDVRGAMAALKELREAEIRIDSQLGPIEQSYAILNKYEVAVPRAEVERLDTLHYAWHKVLTQSVDVQDHLIKIQPQFKGNLLESVSTFVKDVDNFTRDYTASGPMVSGITPQEASDRLSVFQLRFDELWRKFTTYSGGEELFGLPQTQYPDLERIKKELTLLQKLYGLYNDVIKTVNGYFDIPWKEVDIQKINAELLEFGNRCRKLPKALKDWEAFNELRKTIDDFSETCPLLESMSNPAMLPRHWNRIAELTKHPFDVDAEGFELRDIMKAPLLPHKEDIEDICIAANKEKDIESKLRQVIAEWSAREITFLNFKNRGELLLNGAEISELTTLMEDSLMVLSSLMSNRYNAPFKTEIQQWVRALSDTSEIVEKWLIVQNLWVYLEAVFVGGDIAKQLPQEAKRFSNIDKSWTKVMTRAHENTNLVKCCTGDETMSNLLPHMLEQLEVCQKSLTGYLEKKRLLFPRFFFVSDPSLLEVLGQASDSHTIQAHLLNIFDNIKSVTFHEKVYDQILSFSSREGETVALQTPVMASGNVEVWLGSLLAEQQKSLHSVICDAAAIALDPSFQLIEFVNSYPSQVGILGIQILWTRDSEVALNNARSDKKIMAQMDDKFLAILNQLIAATLTDLSKVDRTKYETLVTLHVHQRDIFHDLVLANIKSASDFEWLKQLRVYFNNEERTITIQVTDVNFKYCNEFIGCVERLCVTPLTDRCYITLAQALGMGMGGAPAGPAGTGKTETVKDMGRALGKYVVVFNCSDQMDYRGLGRIYKGLAQSGAWGCFDEFNRIELPVLSVAAQQIAIVLNAKKERRPNFIFMDGDDVSLDPEFGLFLTMNPGYAGRQELPENLKIQFRSVAMMVPDRQIIIRVKLASCGFQNNIILARKFYTLYKLCEEQLTKQVHYDFGLRNILSVLRTLGAEKRAHPEDGEQTIVMRVLRDMNLSKLVDEDEPLFLSLISDLFPGITLETQGYPELEAAIAKNVQAAGLVNHPPWTLKLIQLFETQRVRHGFMVLGPSGTGKTCNINVLMKAMTDNGVPHREMRMNPKAITAPQMFGRLDVATNDWTDGIFSTLWRRTLKTKKGEKTWIVLDGPVDAVWIENLNSVLDDNKLLTLANGDRIPMSPDAKLVFEPHNVDNASPATVSRNGMVFMSPSFLDWRPILEGWLYTRPASESSLLKDCFHSSFDDLHNYVRYSLEPKMKLLECNYIKQAIDLLQGLLPSDDPAKAPSSGMIKRLYTFSLMWSLGAVLELDDRARLQERMQSHESKLDVPTLRGDAEDSIFDYLVGDNGNWEHWSKRVEPFNYPSDSVLPFRSILVPNVDNVRTDFLIQTISKQRKAVLLIGEPGTAKTVMVKGYCKRYNPEEHVFKTLNFSSTTLPNGFQRTIESYVDKRMGSTYGPPGGKRMTVFIDDINMPVINEWRDQIANEIVRQVMAVNGFYSLDKPGDFTNLADMQWVAAMSHPGGGRNDIPERLKRQFSVFNCALPSNTSIDVIFKTIGCGYYCVERGFTKDVAETIAKLVPCTRRLWQDTKAKMLPTPAKFHYVFNLRDVSRIWEGILLSPVEVIADVATVLALWKHECCRVISDRFTTQKDVDWFVKRLHSGLAADLGESYEQQLVQDPAFVDFLRDAPEPTGEEGEDADLEAPKIYERVPSLDRLKEKLEEYLHMYNETVRGAKMDLVFFKDCMVHLMRVSRVIRIPQGNALLVGVGGSGKQSVTRLATSIARYSIFQIQLSRSYNANNLLDDLKQLYQLAGVKGKGVTFIMTDNEIKSEGFLEYINNVLATGEIGGLFARDEIDEMCAELAPVMKKEFPRRPPTNENLYEYFITRVRNNLHVVLCFSPVGEKFRSRALKFPAVFSGCTMDWFMAWPKDALIAVAQHFLGAFDIQCTPAVKNSVVETMGVVQDGVNTMCADYFQRFRRQAYVTPASYLSFLNAYRKLYSEKRAFVGEQARRMNTGLSKLIEAGESVTALSAELAVKEKDLAVASKETEMVLAEVASSAAAAEKVKASVQKVKDKAQAIVDAIDKDKQSAEVKLAAAAPALAEAEAALQTIKPADIATVKKLGKPPHLIMRIMDCVLLLFNRKVDAVVQDPEKPCATPSWKEALKTMNGPLLSELMSFNKDSINEETCELMAPLLEMEDYNFENAKKVCGQVSGLCSWTRAMAFFYTVNKEVLPLKRNLAIAEAKLAVAMGDLNQAQAELDAKQRELDEVQARFDAVMRKKQELEDTAATCRRKMDAASALIAGLGGEKDRWTEQSKEFQAQINRLVGDCLLLCAFMSYSGPFNADFRSLEMTTWKKELSTREIPFTKNLSVTEQLVDTATSGEWALQGLPNDELSLQNGIIVTKATRFPLLIDPQGQGKNWIRNREASNELQVTMLDHKYFRSHIEDALSLGRPLLIEDVGEELDPCLDNVLEKNFIKAGSTYKVKVGDKEVDVMTGFRLYITTKLPNPKYTPEVFARTAIIDFTVTMRGLEDQLLSKVIQTEKQELETERVALLTEVNGNRKKMKELEDNLLTRLTTTQGSLVDDESLIEVLRITKTTAEEVNEKLAIAADTEVKINTAREEYRPVATRGSILYFLIVEMSMVNVMYQTSLDQFLGIFDISMERSAKSPVPTKRIKNIIDFLTYEAFKYTVRGLYENHKFLFTLLLTLKIDLQNAAIRHNEMLTLIKGGAALDLNGVVPKPKPWILDTTWLNLVQLSELPQFSEILNQVTRNDKAWKTWFDDAEPENAVVPDGYNNLDVFRRLLLIRSWCPDRTIPQARKYIANSLGERYAEAVVLNLEHMWGESTTRTPMVCLLSMGSDPTANIQALAKQLKVECREVSMGQGQEVHARKLVQTFQQTGGWALLQNCHLGLDFLAELLDMMLQTENVHESFRVWVTTEPHPKFPINLLQNAIKFTNEPPQGIKAGLKRTFGLVSQEQLDVCEAPQHRPMLYAVAFMHSVVQERRKFGPLGWNIPYEFNQGDLMASWQACQNHLDDMDPKKGVGWATIRYMLSEVHYGGRVTDDRDKRLLGTFCSQWFGDFMFEDKFQFYKGYGIVNRKTMQEYRDVLDTLPNVESTEVFGLHGNADITYQSTMAREVLGTIVDIQPKDSSAGAGESRESVVQRMCNEFLEKLPADFQPHEVKGRLKKMGAFNPMNIFLRQEIDRMQRVVSLVRTTMSDLILAIEGTIIMNEALRDALDNMYDARVPKAWAAISWLSTTLGFWFTELLERHAQFHSWCFEGRPLAFWMTGFFNPQGFITAMRQEITRAHKGWALDSVVCANEVTKYASKEDVKEPMKEGVLVYGLYLDGAGWDRRNALLIDAQPKVLYVPLPVVHMYAVNGVQEKDRKIYGAFAVLCL